MTADQIISRAEDACPNCGKFVCVNGWASRFHPDNSHYKECECECGYIRSVKVDFIGSGDDEWESKLDKSIAEAEKSLKN